MARRTQTYAIRLAVEGGGQVNAPLDRHRRDHLLMGSQPGQDASG